MRQAPYRHRGERGKQARFFPAGTLPMLYVFDCDGVLIDSEIIASEIDAELLTKQGYEITPDQVTQRFAGLTIKQVKEVVEKEMGRDLSDDFIEKHRNEMERRLREDLDPVDGVEEMLDALDGVKCVGSNSSSERLKMTLERTQLYSRLAPNIYSAPEVGTKLTKPDPNVYNFVAAEHGVAPADCIVLEDSEFGVAAARAAGMRVIGFTGGAHTWLAHADVLTEAGAETVIDRLVDYPATAHALHGWQSEAI
ncbi:MAG: HAD family hydrolase [Alphaproteobacteria bacterium]